MYAACRNMIGIRTYMCLCTISLVIYVFNSPLHGALSHAGHPVLPPTTWGRLQHSPVVPTRSNDSKTVLFWNPPPWIIQELRFIKCSKCDFIFKTFPPKPEVSDFKADMIVFHVCYTHEKKVLLQNELPFRHPEQPWAFMCLEPPIWHHDIVSGHALKPFNSWFNLTISYRDDADIIFPYGSYTKVSRSSKELHEIASKNNAAGKTRLILWAVSHCNAPSGRDQYVRAMQRYTKVDVLGQCWTNLPECKRWEKCFSDLQKQYKFYIAFENSRCQDYITEKVWRTLGSGLVPVTLGGADYKLHLPPNSFIDASQYGPEKLVKLLHQINQNDTWYNSFFKWREHFNVVADFDFCRICKYLHEATAPSQVYHHIDTWKDSTTECV